jgi:hypothetical protein
MSGEACSPEEYVKDNDYTISIVRKQRDMLENSSPAIWHDHSVTRTFNFLSRQVSTFTRDMTFQAGGYKYGGSSSVATTMNIQNFDDLPSQAEVHLMHQKLSGMGGHPPLVDDAGKDNCKRAVRLAAPGDTP